MDRGVHARSVSIRAVNDRELLDLREAAPLSAEVQPDGTVKLHLIRPCVGRGKGRHVYEAQMLASNAHKLSGWRMFLDHETESERKQRGGLPRSVKDLGGIVTEARWDPDVPADGRFGQGAVIGTVRPIKAVGDLIEVHPDLVEASINARATGVKPVMRDGQRAWLVEGIEDHGSVDWVTEGGAGGKVIAEALAEAVFEDTREEQEMKLLESMTDEELRDYLQRSRPEVLIAEGSPKKKDGDGSDDPDDDGDDDSSEFTDDDDATDAKGPAAGWKKHYPAMVKRGLPTAVAKKAAKRKAMAMKESAQIEEAISDTDGGDVDPKEMVEAVMASPEMSETIKGLVEAQVEEQVKSRMDAERDRIRAEIQVGSERQIELRDLRTLAHDQIREAKLPDAFERRALAKFQITEAGPTPELDVFESYDDDDNVTESAADALKRVVEAVVKDNRELLREANPTRVRGAGATAPAGDGDGADAPKPDRIGSLTRELFESSNIDPDKAFEDVLAVRG